MAAAFQVICAVLIIAAVIFFIYKNKNDQTGMTTPQMVLAAFQIVLCGWFFALCVSDVLDLPVSFSYERLIVNIFYAIAFLALSLYTLFCQRKENSAFLKGVICAYIALIAVQCFVFPYGTENVLLRIFEALEGAVVFGLLIAVLFKLEDASFTAASLFGATILEFLIAVENMVVPFSSVTDDIQPVDIPLNYAALFMRPVLFASLTLSYRVWLNRKHVLDWISPDNWYSKLFQVFIHPYSKGAELVEKQDIRTSVAASVLHVLCSGTFFYLLVCKTDGLIQHLITWLNDGTGGMLQKLTETVLTFLHDTVITWIGMIPLAGEVLQEPAEQFADQGITSLADSAQTWIDGFFQDFSNALKLPSLAVFGVSVLIVAAMVLLLSLLVWALLKIAKHQWCSFKRAFCLGAVRSTVTIPFAVVSAFLACINPLLGIGLFAFAIFWSMGHMYTAIMAGADQTSGNRFAAWFPPVLILMYLLTAAVMIAILVFVGITLYYQLAAMAEIYISAVTSLTAG